MMKRLSFLILLICSTMMFGQIGQVSLKIQELTMAKKQFNSFELFERNTDTGKSTKYLSSATDVTVLKIDNSELNRIKNEAPELITLSVPYKSKDIDVIMYKQNILTDDFFATDESGNVFNYVPGEYYRGIVNGDFTSLVAISFFENDVIGVISTNEEGNIVLGKSNDQTDYITYSDWNLLGENPFVCGFDDIEYNQQLIDDLSFDPTAPMAPESNKCARIYYEIGYKPYVQRQKNFTETLNWITGIQNNIGTLYDNDDIDVALSQVRIWTYADPYTGDYAQNLNDFRTSGTIFNADIAHFVNFPSTTSVAYLDSLCTNFNYAYSGINMTYSQVPTYSWTIMAMTHEMGHGFGSPHTHACAWNGNNTAIDGCGPNAGYSEGCSGPIPSNGGTIMSYCHLIQGVGINFNNGFGPQPSQLIRQNFDSKPCLGSDCTSQTEACTYAVQKLDVTPLNANDVQIVITDNDSSSWKYQPVPYGTQPNENGWFSTNTKTFTVTGLTPHQYYDVYVANVCLDGTLGAMKKALVLPGTFCDGTMFTDTGGPNGNYGHNQTLVKTFYPANSEAKVKLSFDRIGLQTNADFMYVYDGDTVDAPLFAGGTLTGNNNPGPEFISTHSSGAITIKFVSDGSGATYGWEAHIDCDALGVTDLNDNSGISVYPNPASDILNVISAKGNVESFTLTDTAGRIVLSNKLNAQSNKINIGHLPNGVYILNLKINGKTITKKVVKK